VKTGVATHTEKRTVLLAERPRASVIFTLSWCAPEPRPEVRTVSPLSEYFVRPLPLNVMTLIVREPSRTWILRIPALAVKVIFGSL
jgi:hypothetical protein